MTFCCWLELAGTSLMPPEPLQPAAAKNPAALAATIQALERIMLPPVGILFVVCRAGQRVIDHARATVIAAPLSRRRLNDRTG
jgi:hypothetical protein